MTKLAPPPRLLTADEFYERHHRDHNTDLVDGLVVRFPVPGAKHGYVNVKLVRAIGRYLDDHDIGRLYDNDTFIRVKTNPDRVRGADCAYQSYARFPADAEVPEKYMVVMPELVAEVKSPSDTWPELMVKVQDYLTAGVDVVLVLDPPKKTVQLHRADQEPVPFAENDTLTIPDLLPGFECQVGGLFR